MFLKEYKHKKKSESIGFNMVAFLNKKKRKRKKKT